MKIKKFLNQQGFAQALLIALIAVLVVTNAATVYVVMTKMDNNNLSDSDDYTDINEQYPATEIEDDDVDDEATDEQDTTSTNITIDWNDWPVRVNKYEIFRSRIDDDAQYLLHLSEGDIYKLGKISNGLHTGSDLYLIKTHMEGMAFGEGIYRFIKGTTGKKILLSGYIEHYTPHEDIEEYFDVNDEITIDNLEPPKTINIPNSNYTLTLDATEPNKMLSEYENPRSLFKYNGTDYVYKDDQKKCFIVEANDGTTREYSLDLDFLGQAGESEMYSSVIPYQLDFLLNNGSQNSREYLLKSPTGGCGLAFCYNYVTYITSTSQLTEIGRSANGQIFYKATDPNLKSKPEMPISVLETMYDMYYPGWDSDLGQPKPKISFASFVADTPIIYWHDPFGDFIEFRNAAYLASVECGKPVIYLYPEQETDVYVDVKPAGGFTFTEPVYNDGWNVLAQPSGELYNYADNKTYPYLFWEGYALDYQMPKQGFVISKHEVTTFLEEKLVLLGLVKHEYDEFIEFWQPRMQADEYYFVTFIPQPEFDKLAPLTVSPEPDTVIRVFMDYQALSEPFSVEEQILITPERKGFTVVEWGGALRK